MSWRLPTMAPFHLEATVRVLQRRPSNPVDHWEHDRYRRLFHTAAGPVLLEVGNAGSVDAPDLRASLSVGAPAGRERAALTGTVRRVLGLDVDPLPPQRLAEAEPRLRPVALALRGMRPPRFPGLFEAFASVVPFQQVSLDAGVAIVGRMVQRFGASISFEGERFHTFPSAGDIAAAPAGRLRECGMSWRKAETLRAIARSIVDGELSEEKLAAMSTPDALAALTGLPGIGPWSAGLVLLRGLGRLDVFPAGDVGVARGLGALLRLRSPASLHRIAGRFGAYRGYLYFCALGGALLARGLIQPAPPEQRERHELHAP